MCAQAGSAVQVKRLRNEGKGLMLERGLLDIVC